MKTVVRERRVRNRKPAKGTLESKRIHPKICIMFERDLFERIEDHVTEAQLSSFGEGVRSLCAYAFDMLRRDEQPNLFDYDAINRAVIIANGVLRGEL